MMLRVCCGVLLPCQKISKKLLIAIPQRSIASFVEVPSRPSSCRAAPKNFELRGRPGSRGRWWCMIGPIGAKRVKTPELAGESAVLVLCHLSLKASWHLDRESISDGPWPRAGR